MKNIRNKVLTGSILLIITIATAYLCYKAFKHSSTVNSNLSKKVNNYQPVVFAEVTNGTIDEIIGAVGETQAKVLLTLGSNISGQVMEVNFEEGSVVRRGDLLIRLDDSQLLQSIRSEEKRLELKKFELQGNQEALEKQEALYQKKINSLADIQNARLKMLKSAYDVSAAETNLSQLRHNQKSSHIEAPVDGVVLARFVNPFEMIKVHQPLMELADISEIFVKTTVDADKISSIRNGQLTIVTFGAFPNQEFQGKVIRVGPKVDSKKNTFDAYVLLKNPDFLIKPGMVAFVRFLNPRDGVAIVPDISLLDFHKNKVQIFQVDSNGRATLKQVKTGASANGYTEVLNGIKPGDRVIMVGQYYIDDKVTVVQP